MAKEPLGLTLNSIHNLSFYLDTMSRVRAELAGLSREQAAAWLKDSRDEFDQTVRDPWA
jgi:queuine/archaeosine tRNA-ribosyltransferase